MLWLKFSGGRYHCPPDGNARVRHEQWDVCVTSAITQTAAQKAMEQALGVFVCKRLTCLQPPFGPDYRFLGFYARLAKTLHNELEIGRVFVRQHLAAMFKGIVRVDAKDLLPLGTGFLRPTQMTETCCQ
jgi:hypothetical protein